MCSMHKLLIAEDELWISALIRSIIQKGVPNIRIIGEAANGRIALEMIQEHSPDVVLLDINMPIMDGLSVIEQATASGFVGKVIIISGHEDFSYAQQALRLGVENYLLKPIDDEKLCGAVMKCLQKIEEDRDASHQFLKNKALLETYFFKKLLSEQGALTIEECKQNYGLHFSEGNFLCVVAKFSQYNGSADTDYDNIVSVFHQRIHQSLEAFCTEILHFSQRSVFYLFLGYPPPQSPKVHQSLHTLLNDLLEYCTDQNMIVNAGISDEGIEFSQLYKIYQNAQNTLIANLTQYSSNIVSFRPGLLIQKNSLAVRSLTSKDLMALQRTLNNQTAQATQSWFHQLLDNYIITNRIDSAEALFVLDYSNMLLSAILNATRNLTIQVYVDRVQFFNQFDTCTTIDDLKSRVDIAIKDIFEQIETQRNASDQVIKRAVEYINHHLSDTISLENVAQYVHLTPSYFSEYFKAKTETNFKDYVLQRRIEKATRLLQRSNQQIQDIAAACGYSDVKHFCKLFKKNVGLTPSEFRRIYG